MLLNLIIWTLYPFLLWTSPSFNLDKSIVLSGVFIKFIPNSADPNQNAPKEHSDLGLHCFQSVVMLHYFQDIFVFTFWENTHIVRLVIRK